MTFTLGATKNGFNFFRAVDSNDRPLFNVVPEHVKTVTNGYYDSYHPCNMRKQINIFKYLK